MRRSRAAELAAVAGLAAGQAALGIGGPTAANVSAATDYPFVGRVQTIWTNNNDHVGTGSYLGRGVVLTCAHVIDPHAGRTPMRDFMGVEFERFQLGATRYAALGVQHPLYERTLASGEGLSVNDVGLLLVLNRPASPGADPVLAKNGAAVGDRLTAIGFTDNTTTPASSRKRRGLMRIRSTTGGLYSYVSDGTVARGDYTEPGDSGGPHLRNVAAPGNPPAWEIAGITRSGATWTEGGTTYRLSEAVRVDEHLDFIRGDGVFGQRIISNLAGTANTNWDNRRAWAQGSARTARSPMKNGVAVLDPTTGSDADTRVTINGGTADLDGLLNDTTIDVQRGALKVVGSVGQTSGRRTGTGALNAGRIWVGGSGHAASMEIGWNMQNDGYVGVYRDGSARFGSKIPGGYADAVYFNAGETVVDGGRADVDLGMLNSGRTTVKNGTLNAGRFLPAFVNAATPGMRSPEAVRNWGRFDVAEGGTFVASNGDTKTTALFRNHDTGAFNVEGTNAAPALATVDRVDNMGSVNVFSHGRLNVVGGMVNAGTLSVRGTHGPALYRGLINNTGPRAEVTVGSGGRVEATLPGGQRYGVTYGGFINSNGGRVSIEGGGVLDAEGRFENHPGSAITIGSSRENGAGVLSLHSARAGTTEANLQWGSLTFETPEGAQNARMEMRDLAWTLSPGATVTGRGTIRIAGRSPLNIACDVSTNNWNDIHLVYDGAKGANDAFIPLEAACRNVGGASFAGLSLPFALEELCLVNNSRVMLADGWGSMDPYPGAEVVYVERLGITAGSILDLAGRTLYFKDWGCGGAFPPERAINGNLVRLVPAPSGVLALAFGLLAAKRRRRATT